jgi:hypothetical protein
MKNQKVYGDGVDIESVHPDGYGVGSFNKAYPKLRITYNEFCSPINPSYKTIEVNLSDVWLIGRQYFPCPEEEKYLYADEVGVNHPNARKALVMKSRKMAVQLYGHNFEVKSPCQMIK